MVNETEFLFFFSSGRGTATGARGAGVMVEPEIVSEALKEAVASRSHLSVCPGFEYISMLIYYIYLSFDAHSAII